MSSVLMMKDGTEVELTKDEAARLHRELWGWLAENPSMEKADWPGWDEFDRNQIRLENYCFACMATDGGCNGCLLIWPGGDCCDAKEPNDSDGLFMKWECYDEDLLEGRAELARQIRDLPVREEE